MATVYILFSKKLNKYYTGSCLDLKKRLEDHKQKRYGTSFTSRAEDWEIFLTIGDLTYQAARGIELHIKKMKSRKYIENLRKYPEMRETLKMRYT